MRIGAALNAPEDGKRIRSAAKLLRRMQALGISRYHPNPVQAITEAEKRQSPHSQGLIFSRVHHCNTA